MNKKKLLPFLLLSAAYSFSQAQTTNSVLSPGGNFAANSGNTLTYTIGETMVPTFKQGNNSLTQGFNQPVRLVITNVTEVKNSYSVNAYPNPAQAIVNIDITGDLTNPLSMEIFDINGARVSAPLIQNDKSKIQFNMEGFAAGYYSVHLTNAADHSSSVLKIVKIN